MKNNTNIQEGSFLRWAGSKRALINEIKEYFPNKYSNYFEPFLGSGALFFSISDKSNCFISDSNQKLINTYIQIRDNVDNVIEHLKKYRNEKEFYYFIRNYETKSLIEEASKFIFLNRTCFNGLYRVNKNDKFNVPYGKRPNVDFVTEELLRNVSFSLKSVNIFSCDFEDTISKIKRNDLVFIDPPYVVSHNDNGFIEYNQKIFSWEDQIRLHDYIQSIIKKRAYFILTNAAHLSLKELYSDICIPVEMKRISKIGGKNSYRGIVNEFLFTNTF